MPWIEPEDISAGKVALVVGANCTQTHTAAVMGINQAKAVQLTTLR